MRLKLEILGELPLVQRIDLLRMPSAKRRRLLGQIGRQLIVSARARIRQQRTVDGEPFARRKDGGDEKMLRRMGRRMSVRTTDDLATVSWAKDAGAKIAFLQQTGTPVEFDAKKMQKIYGVPNHDSPATRKQAKTLRDLGYKIRRKGVKGTKKPSLKWIVENIKRGQAGIIIRSMREELATGNKKWIVKTSARPFLGANDDDKKNMVDLVIKTLAAETKARMSAKKL